MKIKLAKKKKNLTRCGRQLYVGTHSIRNVVQCKSNTKKKKDVVKEQHTRQNVGYI